MAKKKDLKEQNPKFSVDIIEILAENDPTATNKYLPFMIKQSTFEWDGIYNYKFPHTIKEGEVKYVKHNVKLPDHIKEKINTRFSWVNDLVRGMK